MLADTNETATATNVADILAHRVSRGIRFLNLESSSGRILYMVTNTERVMVMLLDDPEDSGWHATSPGSTAISTGYIIEDGQNDEYADADTVPLDRGLEVIRQILRTGQPPIEVE